MTKELCSPTPSEEEIATAAEILSRMSQGFLDRRIFDQGARLFTIATAELVPLRGDSIDTMDVLLLQRPTENDSWPGQWHVPGTVMRPSDQLEHTNDYRDAFSRLIGEGSELGPSIRATADPVEVRTERRRHDRGAELSVVFYAPVEGEPEVGEFFPINGLLEKVPEKGIISLHVDLIGASVKRYLEDLRRQADEA